MSCLKEKIRHFQNKNLIIDLIFEKKDESTNKKINDILSECDEKQIEFIENILKTTKDALDKYDER